MESVNRELIRRHIKRLSPPDENRQVEDLLQTSPDFKAAYEEEKLLLIGVAKAERGRLKEQLRLARPESKKPVSSRYYWYAASVVPLIIGAYFLFFTESSSNQLFDEYYQVYGVYEFGSERGEKEDSIKTTAFKSYLNKDYSQALEQFESLIAQTGNKDLNLYLGICYMEAKDYANAEKVLQEVEISSDYSPISRWYSALCHIQLDRREEAVIILNQLIDQRTGLSSKAQALRNNLK